MFSEISNIKQLLREHEAQRAQLEWLERSIDGIIPQRLTVYTPGDIKKIRMDIRNLDNALYYLKEGAFTHAQRDKVALHGITNDDMMKQIDEVHERIAAQLDKAVMQIDLANSEKWNIEELVSYLEKVKAIVQIFHQMVVDHTCEEDVILNRALSSNTV